MGNLRPQRGLKSQLSKFKEGNKTKLRGSECEVVEGNPRSYKGNKSHVKFVLGLIVAYVILLLLLLLLLIRLLL